MAKFGRVNSEFLGEHKFDLQHVQVFTALRLGDVGEADLVQDLFGDVQRHLGARVAQVGGAGALLALLLEADLRGGEIE